MTNPRIDFHARACTRRARRWCSGQAGAALQPLYDAHRRFVLQAHHLHVNGIATAKALDYALNRWDALARHLTDGQVSVDNHHLGNLLRPLAMGRKTWLFAGRELAGKRAAVVMSPVHSVRLHDHDPYAYLRDVLHRPPTHLK